MSNTVGPYTLGELLGEGASARVYAARDRSGREVALKILKRRVKEDPIGAARLEREASVLASLEHPALVRVLDAGQDGEGHPWIALERLAGRTLRERLREGKLAPSEAWAIVRRVGEGTRAAHAVGVLHRDITSANVIVDERGRARLSDFGLALRAEDPRLSREHASVGTPAYMAPEQWWGARLDERTDVYGLGALLYECLCGVPPWDGEDPAELLHRVATSAPRSLRERGLELPSAFERFVLRCLARRPEERPPDVQSFLHEGDRALGQRPRPPIEALAGIAVVFVIPILLGYGGSHDPRSWLCEAGYGAYASLLAGAIGALIAWRRPSLALLAPILPWLSGALVFVTGMQAVLAGVARTPSEDRFVLFHAGLAEASSGFFLGAWLGAAIAVSVALRGAPSRLRWPAIVLALVTLGAGIASLEAGAIATGLVAAALIVRGAPARGPEHALGSLITVVALAVVSWIRLVSESARLWSSDLARADRAIELTRLDRSQTAAWMVALVAIVAVSVAGQWRGALAWPRRRQAIALVVALLAAVAGAWPWLDMRVSRASLWRELEAHYSAWDALDPPRGRADHPARIGTTLRLARDRIAVDGEIVAPTRSLESAVGPSLVAARLGPRLVLDRDPELVLVADRSLPWPWVARALGVARELGVRRVDLVVVTGRPLAVSPSAPPEASVMLPRDLGALELRIEEGPGALSAAEEGTLQERLPRLRTSRRVWP